MKNPREVRRAVIFCARAWLHRAKMRKLDAFFRKDPILAKLADTYPFVYEQPTRAFFYNKSTFDERVRIVESHMQFLRGRVREDVLIPLYQRQSVLLWTGLQCMDEQMTAALFFDYGQRKEGLMSVILRLGESSLYQIIFWIAPAEDGTPAMWIGAMQGPNMAHARDVVKQATKACHSYRTKNLVLYVAQAAARALGLCHIYAGITSLDGAIDTAVFHISADNIITHTERNDLFIMKNILYHHDRTVFLSICLFV